MITTTQRTLAQALGITPQAVTGLIERGTIQKLADGQIDFIAGVKSYVETITHKLARRSTDIDASKARKEAAQAERAEIITMEIRKSQMSIADVRHREDRITRAIHRAIDRQTKELPSILEGLEAGQIASILDERNRAMLEDLADMTSDLWQS